MGNFEAFSQDSSEIKETDWVKQQVMAELQDLQKESFYTTWEDGKVNYDMEAVKNYLTTIKQKNWSDLTSKNSSAWIMAVQIALEERGIDVGKVDGIFGAGTRAAVRTFQEKNGITADGLPGPQTIAKLLEGTAETPANTTETPANTAETPVNTTETTAKPAETVTETSEKMDLTKVNIDVLKKVYGETIDENWKGFQEKRKVIEIWGLKFKKWTEGMTGLGYKVEDIEGYYSKFYEFYIGEYVDWHLTGKGVFADVLPRYYEWDWKDDKRNWKGKYIDELRWRVIEEGDSGIDTWEWDWKDGEKHGRMKAILSDGQINQGNYVNGEREWRGSTTYPNGDKLILDRKRGHKEWKWDYIFSTGEKIYWEWKYLDRTARECTKKIYNTQEPLVIKIPPWAENWIIRATSYENALTFKKDGKNLHLLPETEPPTIISLNDFDKALRAIHLINYAIKMTKDLAKKEGKKFDHFWSNGDSLIIGREKNSIKSFFATTLKKNVSQDIGMTAYDLAKYLNANAEKFGLLNAKKSKATES